MAFNLFKKIRRFLIPVRENNYHPLALRRTALFSYSVFLLILNLFAGQFSFLAASEVAASEISTTRLIELANQERSAKGLTTLKTNSKLTAAAKSKANDMFEKGYWAHYGPSGETPWQFILGSGYSYIYAGENLAKDFVTTDAIHSAWMASTTHRANIIKSEYRDIGIAAVSDMLDGEETTIVVQMFGTTSSVASEDVNTLPTTAENTQPSTTKLQPPTITFPVEDGFYNDEFLDVKGTVSEDGKEITFYNNNTKIGSLLVDGGVFDYRPTVAWEDGQHVVSASVSAKTSGILSDKSDPVQFTIDTTQPEIYEETIETSNIEASGEDIIFTLSFQASPDTSTAYLFLGENEFEMTELTSDETLGRMDVTQTFTVKKSALENNNFEGKLLVRDKALNETATTVDLSALSDQSGEVASAFVVGSTAVGQIFNQLNTMSFISKVTIFVAIFVGFVFLLDAFALWKMGVIRDGAKSAFMPFIFMLVILVSMFIGAGGSLA